jgi:hypothetical protein
MRNDILEAVVDALVRSRYVGNALCYKTARRQEERLMTE